MNPRTEALRFRIWQYAAPLEWNVTFVEIADALNESPKRVGAVMRHNGWHNRCRVGSRHLARYNRFGSFGNSSLAAHIVAGVVAGRISSEAAI